MVNTFIKSEQDMKEMIFFVIYNKSVMDDQSYKPQDSSNVTNNIIINTGKELPLDVCYTHIISGTWMFKQKIIPPKFYEILLKI